MTPTEDAPAKWTPQLGDGGWVRFRGRFERQGGTSVPASVHVRFRRRSSDGALEARELYITEPGHSRLSVNDLRAIPLGRFETIANGRGWKGMIEHHLQFADEVDDAALEWLDVAVPEATKRRRPRQKPPPLNVPRPPREGRRVPDDFYERVLAAYMWLAGPGGERNPAARLAEENGVTVSTVHRWIKEARRRRGSQK